MKKPDYYLVIDVEATCSDDDRIPRQEMEIIEIGAVMVSAVTLDAIEEYQTFVKPVRNPQLTPFCRDLTSIRQIEVETAPLFPQAMADFSKWLAHYRSFLFCSWGEYDRVQFERDCSYHRIDNPLAGSHLNLKKAFAKRNGLRRPIGMSAALKHTRLPLRGRHHRGIDDAVNIARMLPFIV